MSILVQVLFGFAAIIFSLPIMWLGQGSHLANSFGIYFFLGGFALIGGGVVREIYERWLK